MDHNWNHIFNITDAQNAFTELQGVINHLIENCLPEQTVTMNYKNRHPWLTPKLKVSIKKGIQCLMYVSKTLTTWIFKTNINHIETGSLQKIRNAQLQYHSNEFDIVKNDVSKS